MEQALSKKGRVTGAAAALLLALLLPLGGGCSGGGGDESATREEQLERRGLSGRDLPAIIGESAPKGSEPQGREGEGEPIDGC